jgi:hypothetical protein
MADIGMVDGSSAQYSNDKIRNSNGSKCKCCTKMIQELEESSRT